MTTRRKAPWIFGGLVLVAVAAWAAQFGRPAADQTETGAWRDSAAAACDISTAPCFDEIDETVASDSDFAESDVNPVDSELYEFDVGSITDPGSGTCTLRCRACKNSNGGRQLDATCEIHDSALLASITFTDLTATCGTSTNTFSVGDVDSWGSLGDLFIRFDPEDVSGSGIARRARITWAEVECPDAGGAARRGRVIQ